MSLCGFTQPGFFCLQLHYTFQKMYLLQEPFLVVGAFYLLFLLVIIYVRLDFSITKVCKMTNQSLLVVMLFGDQHRPGLPIEMSYPQPKEGQC